MTASRSIPPPAGCATRAADRQLFASERCLPRSRADSGQRHWPSGRLDRCSTADPPCRGLVVPHSDAARSWPAILGLTYTIAAGRAAGPGGCAVDPRRRRARQRRRRRAVAALARRMPCPGAWSACRRARSTALAVCVISRRWLAGAAAAPAVRRRHRRAGRRAGCPPAEPRRRARLGDRPRLRAGTPSIAVLAARGSRCARRFRLERAAGCTMVLVTGRDVLRPRGQARSACGIGPADARRSSSRASCSGRRYVSSRSSSASRSCASSS